MTKQKLRKDPTRSLQAEAQKKSLEELQKRVKGNTDTPFDNEADISEVENETLDPPPTEIELSDLSEHESKLLEAQSKGTEFALKTDNTGRTVEYVVVNQLPTHFRSYPEIDKVFVRGLNMEESIALSKVVDPNKRISVEEIIIELSNIYSEAIKGIDIERLELIDFTILNIISSIWTVDGFGWNPNLPCAHTDEEGNPCPGIITDKIVLDDFNFQTPIIEKLPIEINLGGKRAPVGSYTVKDAIEKNLLIQRGTFSNIPESTLSTLIDYASLIKDGRPLDERVNTIRYSQPYELKELFNIYSDIYIKIDLIEKFCPVCNKSNKLKISLNQVRGYP